MFGRRRYLTLFGIAAAAVMAMASLGGPTVALASAAPAHALDVRGSPTRAVDSVFDFSIVKPSPQAVYLVRQAGPVVSAVAARDDAIPVGRLRSFAARYAPWRGSPWMSPEPLWDRLPDE